MNRSPIWIRKHHVGLSAAARACELADAELLLHLTTAPSPPIAAGAYLPPLLRVELSRSRVDRRPVVDSDQLRPPFVDSSHEHLPLPPPSRALPSYTSESLISPWSPRPYAASSSFYAVGAEIHKRSPTRPILCCRLSADSVTEAPSIAPR